MEEIISSSFEGKSNSSGFCLIAHLRRGTKYKHEKITIKTEGFSNRDMLEKTAYLLIGLFIIIILTSYILAIFTEIQSSILLFLSWLQLTFPAALLLIIVITIWKKPSELELRERAEWHAAEHKLITLLEKGYPLTLENLRRMPMESIDCGNDNGDLREPSLDKLREAIGLGQKYFSFLQKK